MGRLSTTECTYLPTPAVSWCSVLCCLTLVHAQNNTQHMLASGSLACSVATVVASITSS